MSTPAVQGSAPPSASRVAAASVDATKIYGTRGTQVVALAGASIEFARGEFTAIMGPSGSGKSTLMHCLAGLDRLSSGSVFIAGVDLSGLDDKRLTLLRREQVGFIFQAFDLIPTLSAAENITLPMDLGGRKADQQWPNTVIDTVGLRDRRAPSAERALRRPAATCRRLTRACEPSRDHLRRRADGQPRLEDRQRDPHVHAGAVDELGQTVVMVTHDPNAAGYADRILFLADGRLVDEMADPTPAAVLDKVKALGD